MQWIHQRTQIRLFQYACQKCKNFLSIYISISYKYFIDFIHCGICVRRVEKFPKTLWNLHFI